MGASKLGGLNVPGKKRVIVIGGGPAGMMAAGTAGRRGLDVTLIEKNERLGRKLLLTGKGRCNITNDADVEGLISNVPVNGKFLYSAFYTFSNHDLLNLLHDLGLATKVERGRTGLSGLRQSPGCSEGVTENTWTKTVQGAPRKLNRCWPGTVRWCRSDVEGEVGWSVKRGGSDRRSFLPVDRVYRRRLPFCAREWAYGYHLETGQFPLEVKEDWAAEAQV